MYISIDLDDTLLDKRKHLSNFNYCVLQKCRMMGHKVIINTARNRFMSDDLIKTIGYDYFVLNAGSQILNHKGEMIINYPIANEVLDRLIPRLLENAESVSCQEDDILYSSNPWRGRSDVEFYDFEKPFLKTCYKILVKAKEQEKIFTIAEEYGLDCTNYLNGSFMRINSSEATKWKAIEHIVAYDKGDINNVISFGDDYGDLEMLTKSSVGVAMANSMLKVLDEVPNHALSNEQNGVGNYLISFFNINREEIINMERELLYQMLEEVSVSGREFAMQEKIRKYISKYVDRCDVDHVGNVMAIKNPQAEFKVMLAAHSDEIGLTITRILADGRCALTDVGSITPFVYAGQRVQVKTKKGIIYGAVAKPRHKDKIEVEDLLLDLGVYSGEEAAKLVEVGDVVVHDYTYREINDHILSARALDDKIGIYCITEATKRAVALDPKIGIYCTSTVGEETTKNGAKLSSRKIAPTCSITVDVGSDTSINSSLGNSSYTKLGGGPIITVGTTLNPNFIEIVKNVASSKKIPLQFNTSSYRTLTDHDAIHYEDKGIPSILISIPLRYMHSPAEVVDMNDVEMVIDLIAGIIKHLDNHHQKISFLPM